MPADLLAVASQLDGSAFVSLELMTAVGYDEAYPELNLTSYLNDAGKNLLVTAAKTCLVSVDGFGQIIGTAFHHVSDFTTSNPLDDATWKARIDDNKLGSGKPTVPVFQYQCCSTRWRQSRRGHRCKDVLQGAALDFLSARFAGTPVTSNC